ncbi:MAG: putative amino acid dehydrogenase [bacterium]|jgi:predicted amino acid dehydrogenase
MKEIVSIAMGPSSRDYEFITNFLGHDFRVRRFGADGDIEKAKTLIKQYGPEADMVGLGSLPDHAMIGTKKLWAKETQELEELVPQVEKTTGAPLRRIIRQWFVREIQQKLDNYFNNAKVLFFSGIENYDVAKTLEEYTQNMKFADPIRDRYIPKLLNSVKAVELYAAGSYKLGKMVPSKTIASSVVPVQNWSKFVLRKAIKNASVVIGPNAELQQYSPEELAGKVILTSAVRPIDLAVYQSKGVDVVIDDSPQPFDQVVGLNVLDAMIVTALQKNIEDMTTEDYLEVIQELEFEPKIHYPSGKTKRKNRFSFVIHPLSQENFKQVKAMEIIANAAPPIFMDAVEKAMAYAPPFIYTKIEGVKSPTGVEAEGWLISIGGTPKQILSHPPEFTYRRLLAAAKMSEKLGAQIMGLGAFTKVVGDGGITVAKKATIPITSGNSYSASGALWAASDALKRMNLVPTRSDSKKLPIKAMVIGATGSIGAVCARLLAFAVDEVHIIARGTSKLLWLQNEIGRECPDTKIVVSTKADEHIAEMDMIVTSTSGAGKKILDIMKVKPGCVITDVARPLDLPPSEVAKRPDVLVIESGEIALPGNVKMKSIGFDEPEIVYACLAETIVLCLEGKFEVFTIGRDIQWEKVKEIYTLGLKHGMKLAAISGVNGVYTDDAIAKVREAAIAAGALTAEEREQTLAKKEKKSVKKEAETETKSSTAK